MTEPLAGLHVVEIATEISGPYAGKLLVDLGAEVDKIEPPGGDPLRRWGPFPGGAVDPHRCGLFEYLNAGKRIAALADARDLIAQADVLIENLAPGTLDGWGFDIDSLGKLNPNLVLLRISHFGQSGPWRDRHTASLTLQAASGWVGARDPDRPPVQVGARIAEYVAGAHGALGALTALRLAGGRGEVVEVDVSELESLVSTLPYPMLMARKMQSLGLPANARGAPMLGVVRAADGWVGINCLTGQHWLDVCAMLGLPEFADQQIAIMLGGPERAEFYARAEPLLAEQNRRRNRRTEPGAADSGHTGQRRRHRAGLSAIRHAWLLRRRRWRGVVLPEARLPVPVYDVRVLDATAKSRAGHRGAAR